MKKVLPRLFASLGFASVSVAQTSAPPAVPPEAPSEPPEFSAYERGEFQGPGEHVLPYRILFPVGYPSREAAPPESATSGGGPDFRGWPLVLSMHGAGERGEDNAKQLKFGARLFLEPGVREKFPAIVVFPQCASDGYWVQLEIRRTLYAKEEQDFREVFEPATPQLEGVMGLVEELVQTEAVDEDRVYVIGLSMGALGTYELLARKPERWAAAVAICGGGNLEATERYAGKVPVWITHGDKDAIVPVEYSRRLYAALKEQGAEDGEEVRYTEFAGVAHDAWTPTLKMEGLLEWVFEKRRGQGGE